MLDPHFTLGPEFPAVSYATWRAQVERELKGASFERKLVARTYEGIELQPLYTAQDFPATDAHGFPGSMPFARGRASVGGMEQQLAQERAEPSLDVLNKCILEDLEHGVDRIHLRFDQAARHGFDGDDADAGPLLGVDGACLYSVDDLDAALRDVRLDAVAVSLEAGAAFLPASAALVALWQRRGHPLSSVRGAFNADPLAVMARDGELPMALSSAFDQMADLVGFTASALPNVHSIRVGSAPYHHAGATAEQDLGFSMATAIEYLRQLEARGAPPTEVAGQFLFNYALGTNLFLAIAKLRAARVLWARVLEVCGVKESARAMTMHVKTSKRVITSRDPWVNLLRNTTCGFAAAIGGAEIFSSAPFDAALGLPNALGRRIARNTPVILREESYLGRVVDPAGGSWMIERLTQALAERAWSTLSEVEAQGGMAQALRSGWVHEQVRTALAPRLKNIATRRDAITGVSEFPNLKEAPLETVLPDPVRLRAEVRERLSRHRAAHPGAGTLEGLRNAQGTQRVEALVAAGNAGSTFGQLARQLNSGSPERLSGALAPHPYAEPFEHLRDAADQHLAAHGVRPRVYLANLGTLAEHNARSVYSRGFFEAGGFEVLEGESLGDVERIAAAYKASGAPTAIICSSDAVYEQRVGELAPALRRAGARSVILAGNPGQHEARYREAGVDRFIYMRCDVVATLRDLLAAEGIES